MTREFRRRAKRTTSRRAKALARRPMRDLVTDVEDLVKNIVDVSGVDLATIRSRVERSIADARESFDGSAHSAHQRTHVGASGSPGRSAQRRAAPRTNVAR